MSLKRYALLCGLALAGSLWSVVPASAIDIQDDINDFMSQNYGPYSEGPQVWHRVQEQGHPESEAADFKICAQQDVPTAFGTEMLLAACKLPVSSDLYNQGVDAWDLYVLRRDSIGHLFVASSALGVDTTQGGIPGPVNIRRFGANLYGFVIDMTADRTTHLQTMQAVYLPSDEDVVGVALVDTELDTEASQACKASRSACVHLHYDLQIDQANPLLPLYPLRVQVHGTDQDKEVHWSVDVPFDKPTGTYKVPVVLQRNR